MALTQPQELIETRGSSLPALGDSIQRRQQLLPSALEALAADPALARASEMLIHTLRRGGKALIAGNGGSAAEAQHFAAELVGRFQRERAPYAAIALSVDTSILTAIGNDYGYEHVFSRQVGALGRSGDVLIAYSTSGESENLLLAAIEADRRGMSIIAVTGQRQSRLGAAADVTIRAPAPDTPLTQEIHMMVTHLLCESVERALADDDR